MSLIIEVVQEDADENCELSTEHYLVSDAEVDELLLGELDGEALAFWVHVLLNDFSLVRVTHPFWQQHPLHFNKLLERPMLTANYVLPEEAQEAKVDEYLIVDFTQDSVLNYMGKSVLSGLPC